MAKLLDRMETLRVEHVLAVPVVVGGLWNDDQLSTLVFEGMCHEPFSKDPINLSYLSLDSSNCILQSTDCNWQRVDESEFLVR